MDLQTVISLGLVLLAALYLMRVAWRRWRGLADEGSCGGCAKGCGSLPSTERGPGAGAPRAGGRQLVELPSLDATRR
jgi:hypothetical protein